jgi:DNA-binding NtrC family response regulator
MEKKIADINAEKKTVDMASIQEFMVSAFILKNIYDQNIPLKKFISDLEKQLIKNTLLIAYGNQKCAASILGIKQTTLFEKIKKYKIKKIRKSLFNNHILIDLDTKKLASWLKKYNFNLEENNPI